MHQHFSPLQDWRRETTAVALVSTMSMNDSSQAVEMSGSSGSTERKGSVFGLELVIRRCPQNNAFTSTIKSDHQEALPWIPVTPAETGSWWEDALGGSAWHSGHLPSLPLGRLQVKCSPPSIGPLVHTNFYCSCIQL